MPLPFQFSMRDELALRTMTPISGNEAIDNAIKQARRIEFAGHALAGIIDACGGVPQARHRIDAFRIADKMVEEMMPTNEKEAPPE